MIVNARYGFVFVHVPKTAGLSVAAALAELPGRRRAWESRTTRHETYAEFLAEFARRSGRPASRVAGYQVFAFVRNPWDRFLSLHRFLLECKRRQYPEVPADMNDFARLLRAPPAWSATIRSLRPQVDFLPGDGARLTVGRFETLTEDFARIGRQLGAELPLPHLNATLSAGADYRARYQPDAAGLVGTHFVRDVEALGYTFD